MTDVLKIDRRQMLETVMAASLTPLMAPLAINLSPRESISGKLEPASEFSDLSDGKIIVTFDAAFDHVKQQMLVVEKIYEFETMLPRLVLFQYQPREQPLERFLTLYNATCAYRNISACHGDGYLKLIEPNNVPVSMIVNAETLDREMLQKISDGTAISREFTDLPQALAYFADRLRNDPLEVSLLATSINKNLHVHCILTLADTWPAKRLAFCYIGPAKYADRRAEQIYTFLDEKAAEP